MLRALLPSATSPCDWPWLRPRLSARKFRNDVSTISARELTLTARHSSPQPLKMTAQPRSLSSSKVVNIEDLRQMAQRRIPKAVFDYLDGGAEAELTLKENCRAFRDVTFRPHGAVSVSDCKLSTTVAGHELAVPFLLAPVGYSRLMHPEGEVAAAAVAGEVGTGYILSTISAHRLEDVKAATNGPTWYQLYLLGGREAAEGALERARKA